MKVKTMPYDPAILLKTDRDIAAYLQGCYDTGEPEVFLMALRDVAKIKGLAKLATQTGLSRESLYKSLSGKRQPKFDTLQKILIALDVKVRFAA